MVKVRYKQGEFIVRNLSSLLALKKADDFCYLTFILLEDLSSIIVYYFQECTGICDRIFHQAISRRARDIGHT